MYRLDIVSTVAEQPTGLPEDFQLFQNYPNPTTTIRYDLPVASHVTIRIYNILGQEVRTLVNQIQDAGYMSVRWDATNNKGNQLGSGVYFCRLEATAKGSAGSFVQTQKTLLLK